MKTVSTVMKSPARMLACARKKTRHDECARCGAGWRPSSSGTLRTDVVDTPIRRPLSSPTIRLYPQCGFSRPRRRISSRSERSSGGRPGPRCEYVQRRAISWRCQQSSVSGLNEKPRQSGATSGSAPPGAHDPLLLASALGLADGGSPTHGGGRESPTPDNEIHKRPEQAASLDHDNRAPNLASPARQAIA
jgi:hypothetical protein